VGKRGVHPVAGGRASPPLRGCPPSLGVTRAATSRTAFASRLRERLPEIQAAVATRVYAISVLRSRRPAYLQGLNAASAPPSSTGSPC